MTRQEAYEILCNGLLKAPSDHDWATAFKIAIENLSADVRENVKGEWIDEKRLSYEYDGNEVVVVTWKCSKCGEETNVRSNFCPECGADMKGEKDV